MSRQTRLQKFMEILRQQRPMLAEQYNVATLELFGSYVRHEQRGGGRDEHGPHDGEVGDGCVPQFYIILRAAHLRGQVD